MKTSDLISVALCCGVPFFLAINIIPWYIGKRIEADMVADVMLRKMKKK